VGVGWDLALLSLDQHGSIGAIVDPPQRGPRLTRAKSSCIAAARTGVGLDRRRHDEELATCATGRTRAFYTGESEASAESWMHAFDMLADPVRGRICRRGRTYLERLLPLSNAISSIIKFKNDKKHPARRLLVRELTVGQELADCMVKNSRHLCSSACSDWVRPGRHVAGCYLF